MSKTHWIVACVVCLACDSSPPIGNDSGGPPLPCPSQPNAGDSCDAGGLSCEYGSDPNLSCNTIFECTGIIGSMTWGSVVPDAGASCPTTIPDLDPSCPKNVPSGLCADDAATPLCHYATGYCTCVGTA